MSKGFQYYKLDTNRYEDIRIRKLRRAHSTKGIAVYDYLLARIYGSGCYTMCDNDCICSVSDYFDLNENTVREIIVYCASVGLFDKGLLMRDGVITSKSIQRRFVDMCKATKRIYINVPSEYLLLTAEEIGLTIKRPKNSGRFEKTPEDLKKLQSLLKNSGGNDEDENSGENEKIPEEIAKTPEDLKKLRNAQKEKNQKKKENVIIVEFPSKEENSMSDTPNGVTDASSSSSPSLFGDEVPEKEKSPEIDYTEIIKYWNTTTNGVFGSLKSIDNRRRTWTRARIREYGIEAFYQAIRNVAASEFLRGASWFSYDWMVRPNNFVKVLEDKYGKKERTDSAGGSGREMSEMDAANSIPMGGGEGRNVKPVRKRVYE